MYGILLAMGAMVMAWQPGEPEIRGFAVVELFTSEGCSSCPPADAVLARLAADAKKEGSRVYALAFHVDYWDYLGWQDPYGDKAHTTRQRAYAKALSARSLYTPQMIVNGKAEFVGSSRARADEAIGAALKQGEGAPLTLRSARVEEGTLAVEYSVILPESVDIVTNAVVNVALVESGLASDVPAGENAGRRLEHERVVRAFGSDRPGDRGQGKVTLRVPEGVKLERAAVVAYVQHGVSMEIMGAAEAPIR